jgi:hypothetical protein
LSSTRWISVSTAPWIASSRKLRCALTCTSPSSTAIEPCTPVRSKCSTLPFQPYSTSNFFAICRATFSTDLRASALVLSCLR